jgi:hypothetical protein
MQACSCYLNSINAINVACAMNPTPIVIILRESFNTIALANNKTKPGCFPNKPKP